ncbi:hypothetical protein [Pseudomonas sp. BN411]|uniref:hypothetical protein n=1 Tax=Pseudomonas sp. BN411 TaxID=2567887 RepID=UPI002455C77D|nr:hypothetical protein [Pseudomonas sp. BN411]MDH4562150.1 hypothetical protein [Pseudomonas sp. BN411]
MKALQTIGLWLALVLCPQFITLKVATWAFSTESHATYERVEQLLDQYDERQENRMANIARMEAKLNARDGEILAEVDKRISLAIQRHEQIKHEDKQ